MDRGLYQANLRPRGLKLALYGTLGYQVLPGYRYTRYPTYLCFFFFVCHGNCSYLIGDLFSTRTELSLVGNVSMQRCASAVHKPA